MATGILASSMLNSQTLNSQTSLQQAKESQLLQQIKTAGGPDQKEKIEKGAREFETLLLQNWLQQAEQSMATVPGADEDEDAGGQTMMSLGVQSLAGAMAANGGIGIAAMITKAMLAMAQKSEPGNGQVVQNPVETKQNPLNSGAQNADRMAVSGKGSE